MDKNGDKAVKLETVCIFVLLYVFTKTSGMEPKTTTIKVIETDLASYFDFLKSDVCLLLYDRLQI